MKPISLQLILSSIFLFSCHQNRTSEDPIKVAQSFCDCVTRKLKDAKDSSVNINECNFEFGKSRLMNIHIDENSSSYSEATLDSANKFFLKVSNIIDTLCENKIDRRKLMKLPHATME